MRETITFVVCALLLCGCSTGIPQKCMAGDASEGLTAREVFYSDSLNSYSFAKPYTVPTTAGTQPPKGYEPVYISSYARHGSRKLFGRDYTLSVLNVLQTADSLGCLTLLGKDIQSKIIVIDSDLRNSEGNLTSVGEEQHRGITERMYLNYPNVFSNEGTSVRLYSTDTQRTLKSMLACNEKFTELNPEIKIESRASDTLTFLERSPAHPAGVSEKKLESDFIREHFDMRPPLEKLFTAEMTALKDSALFIRNLYHCGCIVAGLDYNDIDFIWDLFNFDELFTLQQAVNYYSYQDNSNSPAYGDMVLPTICPLVKDFVDKADEALLRDVPGADLRFGHDSFLISLYALIGVNGYVDKEEDPLKVVDAFQIFKLAPMAGNFQMVFYRDRSGDVLVKTLQNEVESSLPIATDIYPYYHWNNVREHFLTILDICSTGSKHPQN